MASISVDVDVDIEEFSDREIIEECISRCREDGLFLNKLKESLVNADRREPLGVNDMAVDIYDAWMRSDKSDFHVLIDRICNDEERRRSGGMRFKTAA